MNFWPEGFCDIGGKSFDWVYRNRPVFVKHTLEDMKEATGIFEAWQQFCIKRERFGTDVN